MVFESQFMWFFNPTYIFDYNYWDFLLDLYGEMLDLWDKHKLYMEDRA